MVEPSLAQLNDYETEFLYREIFEKEIYLRNGIQLRPAATVLDVGANIGLFSLYIKTRFPSARVFAFEPIPDAYRCLTRNCAPYGETVRCFEWALSGRNGFATFRYYPGYSVISGLHADRDVDASVIETGMRGGRPNKGTAADREIHALVSQRFQTIHSLTVKTRTLERFLAETAIEHIDLLKIDAERAEFEILRGVGSADNWRKIDQLVLEVHSQRARRRLVSFLEHRGYRVIVEEDEVLGSCQLATLYATRARA